VYWGLNPFYVDRNFLYLFIVDLCWERMTSHTNVDYAQKGGSDCGDVSPVPLGSKEFHDPSVVEGYVPTLDHD